MSLLSGETKRRLFDCTTKPRAVSQHQKQTELLGSHCRATFLDSEPLRLGFALCWSYGPCRDIDKLQVTLHITVSLVFFLQRKHMVASCQFTERGDEKLPTMLYQMKVEHGTIMNNLQSQACCKFHTTYSTKC